MLIRFASEKELNKYGLASGNAKVVVAQKRMTKDILGYIVFDKEEVLKIEILQANKGLLYKLSEVAKRQIARERYSFHYRYDDYSAMKDEEKCPVCKESDMPKREVDIATLENSFLGANIRAQGGLFGKCHLISKKHACELYDLSDVDLLAFMKDLKLVSKTLKAVTGAEKINYEFHGNSIPHLHCHLFPRYLDDKFPSLPIDYNHKCDEVYEVDSFAWFVNQMRKRLIAKNENIMVDF